MTFQFCSSMPPPPRWLKSTTKSWFKKFGKRHRVSFWGQPVSQMPEIASRQIPNNPCIFGVCENLVTRKTVPNHVPKLRHSDCMQQSGLPMSLIDQERKRSEVMTAMKDRFTVMELAALRSDLMQGGMLDSRDAAELLQVFLMGRSYGVSPETAMDAAS